MVEKAASATAINKTFRNAPLVRDDKNLARIRIDIASSPILINLSTSSSQKPGEEQIVNSRSGFRPMEGFFLSGKASSQEQPPSSARRGCDSALFAQLRLK